MIDRRSENPLNQFDDSEFEHYDTRVECRMKSNVSDSSNHSGIIPVGQSIYTVMHRVNVQLDCLLSLLTVNLCFCRYDGMCVDGADKYEGVTNLVEHPIQMKPPGESELPYSRIVTFDNL